MPLPTFLIVGAPKAGTTSLYHYLRSHPDVFMSEAKEPHYFSYAGEGQPAWGMRSLDAYEALFDSVHGERATGEASTWYLYSETAAEEIYRALPNTQIIILLRNPIGRAYSSWSYRVQMGGRRRRSRTQFAWRPSDASRVSLGTSTTSTLAATRHRSSATWSGSARTTSWFCCSRICGTTPTRSSSRHSASSVSTQSGCPLDRRRPTTPPPSRGGPAWPVSSEVQSPGRSRACCRVRSASRSRLRSDRPTRSLGHKWIQTSARN